MANEEKRGAPEDIRQQRHEARTNQTFKNFIHELMRIGQFPDEAAATRAAAVVLTRLEMRLTGNEARDLNAQLPMRMVEILQEVRASEHAKPVEKIGRDQFISVIARVLGVDEVEAESIARSVFTAVRRFVSEGEAEDVASQLPQDLVPLWSHPV